MCDYVLQWESPRLNYYWNHNFIHEVYRKRLLEEVLGVQEENFLVDCREDIYSFYLHKREISSAIVNARKFYNDHAQVRRWIKRVFALKNQIDALPWFISEDRETIVEVLTKFENMFHEAVALHLASQPHITRVLEKDILKLFTKHDLPSELISHITLPAKVYPVMQEQIDWYKFVDSYLAGNITQDYIDQHLDKWRYITAGDSRSPMDRAYLVNRMANDLIDPDAIKKQLNGLLNTKNGVKKNDIKKASGHLPQDVVCVANTIRAVSYIRFLTKQMWMKLWFLMETSLKAISRIDTINVSDWTLEEIQRGEHFSSTDNRGTYVYLYNEGTKKLYYNGTDKDVRDVLLSDINFNEIKSVSGDIGYRGKVIGQVLNVGWNDNIGLKFSSAYDKTILVAPQTTPAYVGMLTHCVGLITDEGGITGHASIVSRELKLPSIVGTKFATKVFSDGDWVELDATKGEARKIVRGVA